MIHEYAVEPELVASWHDAMQFRIFVEKFGFGTGRVVSRYPKNWRELVLQSFITLFGQSIGPIGQKRIEELLLRLMDPNVWRTDYIWDGRRSWLENAEREQIRRPFWAILARDNPRNQANVISATNVIAGQPPRWNAPHSMIVDRTATSMAKIIEPMLRCAGWVIFIDPYFRAFRPECVRPLGEFLKVVARVSPTIGVEFHAAHAAESQAPWPKFKSDCEKYLPRIIPVGATLIVRRWANRPGGDELHNRYILSDVGGMQFGKGLDEGNLGTTDDVTLLDVENYRRRLAEYAGPSYAFNLEGEVIIEGQPKKKFHNGITAKPAKPGESFVAPRWRSYLCHRAIGHPLAK